MKKTAQLQCLLNEYQATLPPEQFESFDQEVQRLLHKYVTILSEYNPGALRAQKIHALIEEQITASSHIKVTCQKGCSACCHLEIEITEDDAALLAQSIVELKLAYNESSLKEQAQRSRLDPKWAQGAVSANACVLLGSDGACRNYENRPTVCRKHSVITPVEYCSTLGAAPVPRLIPMNEIILSAALNLPQNKYASYSKMLSSALERLKEIERMSSLNFYEEPTLLEKIGSATVVDLEK